MSPEFFAILQEHGMAARYAHLDDRAAFCQIAADLEEEKCKVRMYRERVLRLEHARQQIMDVINLADAKE